METVTQLYNLYIINNNKLIEERYEKFFHEFLNETNMHVTFPDETATYKTKVRDIKDKYIYDSVYQDIFFDLLQKNNYLMIQEIKDAISDLSHLKDYNNNKEVISKLLHSPFIDDISYDGRENFTISSREFGKFTFMLASQCFEDDVVIGRYIEAKCLPKHCHEHAYYLIKTIKSFYAITSLCKGNFNSQQYHSYVWDKEYNNIIDLCLNIVMKKDIYDILFSPIEISLVDGFCCRKELRHAKPYFKPNDKTYELLKIALVKQVDLMHDESFVKKLII